MLFWITPFSFSFSFLWPALIRKAKIEFAERLWQVLDIHESWATAANGHVRRVSRRLTWHGRAKCSYIRNLDSHGTPARVLFTSLTTTTTTIYLTHCGEAFKNSKTSRAPSEFLHRERYFFALPAVLRIFLEVSTSANRARTKRALDEHSAGIFCNFLTHAV